MKFVSTIGLLVLASFSSCGNGTIESDDLSKTATYRVYNASFDESESKIETYARFSAGGPLETSVRLTDPERIEVEQTRMSIHDGEKRSINFHGTYYSYSFGNRDYQKFVDFTWSAEDHLIQQSVEIPEPFKVVTNVQRIDRNKTFELTTDIAKLKSGESLKVSIRSLEEPSTDAVDSESDRRDDCCVYQTSESSVVKFTNTDLEQLRLGRAEIEIERVLNKTGKDSKTAGFSTTGSYKKKLNTVIQ